MWSLTKTFLGQDDQNVIIREDPNWGFCEFPAPGDPKKHLLPVLLDPEESNNKQNAEEDGKTNGKQLKQFWMPDKFCKVCYACEEPFTMYRRRHHCRMCGQVFCNNCSSYSIDGALFNVPGLVRACQVCSEQANEKTANEVKSSKRRAPEKTIVDIQNAQIRELNAEYKTSNNNLQNRASAHLSTIVDNLIDSNHSIVKDKKVWKEIVVNLIKTVVSSVDPDVRSGDSLDIRPYVKIKVIPGGTVSECVYLDGVVFRKNVSHKKMAVDGTKTEPRILLLAGGIEFQRTEAKLSSMDTLIEQEDKFMEILVEKIMSLKPDIILVGKAVARKAQELLCEHKVIVMQNVKQTILERVARMTGAILLPSTDSMVKQFGEECLGTCNKFWLRLVQDDPERSNETQPSRILRTRISRASTYAYVEGCPSERGCTIVLRGGNRPFLAEIKKIIRFSILVAYHLRLEVAYYNDRFADLPLDLDDDIYDDASDVDDEVVDGEFDSGNLADSNPALINFVDQYPQVKKRKERYFISTSMDIDFNIPYRKELIGTSLFRSKNLTKFTIENHQSLLITSLLVTENINSSGVSIPVQKSPADVKGIKYYTKHDVALGAFIIENCFQLGRWQQRESRMLDQTLSFAHKPGRIDITVKKVEKSLPNLQLTEAENPATSSNNSNANSNSGFSSLAQKDPLHLPLYISSFCRECGRIVTPQHLLSEEVWKMSFGKFLEIMFYNRSAKCTIGGCTHSLRDSHILSFSCENYVAVFEFFPIHPYALHFRESMQFPEDFYWKQTLSILNSLPEKHATLMEDFRLAINVLEREIHDLLNTRPEDLALAMADVHLMTNELTACSIKFYEQLLRTFESLPKRYADKEAELRLRNILQDRVTKIAKSDRPLSVSFTAELIQEALKEKDAIANNNNSVGAELVPANRMPSTAEGEKADEAAAASGTLLENGEEFPTEYNAVVAALFPMIHCRDTFMKAARWNTRIDTIYRFLESVRNMLIQQIAAKEQNALGDKNAQAAGHMFSYTTTEAEELDGEYQSQKKHLTDVVMADLGRNPAELLPPPIVVAGSPPETNLYRATAIPPAVPVAEDISSKEGRSSLVEPVAVGVSVSPNPSVDPAPAHAVPINSLYRTALDQNKRNTEKPVEKISRITKALSRFLAGKQDSNEEQNKFFVPLGEFGTGRFGLKPGRNGEVIPVSEEIPASIIAYTLASEEYYEDLQMSIREDNIDQTGDEQNDLEGDAVGVGGSGGNGGRNNTKDLNDDMMNDRNNDMPDTRGRGKTLQGQHFDNEGSSNSNNSDLFSLSPFKRSNKGGAGNNDNTLPTVQEGEEEEEYLESSKGSGHHHHNRHQSQHKNTSNYGLTSLMKSNFSSEDLASMNDSSNVTGFSSNNNLFNANNANLHSTSAALDDQMDGGNSPMNNPESSMNNASIAANIIVDTVKAGVNTVTNINSNIQEGVKKLIFSSDGNNNTGENQGNQLNFAAHHNANDGGKSISGGGSTPHQQSHTPQQASTPSHGNNNANPAAAGTGPSDNISANEKQMTSQDKSIVRHRFDDYDDHGSLIAKFHCQVYYAKQFEALRSCYFKEEDSRENFVRSLAMSARWSTQGGKSGAAFSKTMDERLVIKQIQRVELQMFLDFAPAYFEYMAKAYYHNLPTVLCKVLGVYTVRYDNKETGKKATENYVVMENIFYQRNITRTFDLKGSSRARYVELVGDQKENLDEIVFKRRRARRKLKERAKIAAEINNAISSNGPGGANNPSAARFSVPDNVITNNLSSRESNPIVSMRFTMLDGVNPFDSPSIYGKNPTAVEETDEELEAELQPRLRISQVLLDDNLMEFTRGRPFPLKHRAKLFFHKAVQNDTLFLSIVNVVDYSILVGFDENKHEMVVGIIDYLRQYDFIKKMERAGKGTVGMLTGQAEPTIIQPSQYRKRFTSAMERYFMTIPDKWISYDA